MPHLRLHSDISKRIPQEVLKAPFFAGMEKKTSSTSRNIYDSFLLTRHFFLLRTRVMTLCIVLKTYANFFLRLQLDDRSQNLKSQHRVFQTLLPRIFKRFLKYAPVSRNFSLAPQRISKIPTSPNRPQPLALVEISEFNFLEMKKNMRARSVQRS